MPPMTLNHFPAPSIPARESIKPAILSPPFSGTTSTPEINPSLAYRNIWRSYLREAMLFSRHLHMLQAGEDKALRHWDLSLPSILPDQEALCSDQALVRLAEKIVRHLTNMAERCFAPSRLPKLRGKPRLFRSGMDSAPGAAARCRCAGLIRRALRCDVLTHDRNRRPSA